MASKNELFASRIRRTEWRLRRMVISSPASNSPTIWPSAFKKAAGKVLMAFTRTVADKGRMMERLDRACGQMGVRAKTSAVGKTIAPARRHGIGGGTGRRTDDQAVATVTGDQFVIHAHVQRDQARDSAAGNDDVIEGGGHQFLAVKYAARFDAAARDS